MWHKKWAFPERKCPCLQNDWIVDNKRNSCFQDDELIVGFSKRFSGGSHSSGHERLKKWKNNFIRYNTQELWTIVIWALPLSFPAAQFIFNKGFIWSFVRNYVLMVTPNLEKKIALIRVWHMFLIPHLLRNIKHSSKCQNNKK